MSARVPVGRKDAALGGPDSVLTNPAPQTGNTAEGEETTQAGAEQVEREVEGGEGEKQRESETEAWKRKLQKAGIAVLKGAVAGALLLAGIPISIRCFVGPPRLRYPYEDTSDWPETFETASRMATGGAVVGGTITTAVLLLGSIENDYPSKDARRTCKGG
ncbi:hypothetical protein KFL_000840140 [Klebsormidium nitens]|uniref:Uncharacterized protein n=1 Tax=Klebsormidium nitens TaxID=105231 RepID=A0A1Y1HX73_KLENI|nr:hypothetical protein KFL_000840140 [Klebsormidium nitens]|eukprot:GAQ81571.1 hypothetical protein KFL_000840140 [Klebsormidium nitens]